MEELQELLRVERDVAFDHCNHRIMCFPHIVNICTGHIIAASTQDDEFDPLQDDPIKRVADFIRYIRSSYSRRESFARSVKLCIDDNPELEKNHPELNSPETKMGRPLELKLHVKTQWDSVYLMIRRFRFLRKVSTRVRTSNETVGTDPRYSGCRYVLRE
jgi:hypothetical protein